jgi:hypothetical protein
MDSGSFDFFAFGFWFLVFGSTFLVPGLGFWFQVRSRFERKNNLKHKT